MQALRLTAALLAFCAGMAPPAQAAPKVISSMRSTATTHSFFTLDLTRLRGQTAAQVRAALQQQLDPLGITACYVTGDLNRTNISCGDGAMRFGDLPGEHEYDRGLDSGGQC